LIPFLVLVNQPPVAPTKSGENELGRLTVREANGVRYLTYMHDDVYVLLEFNNPAVGTDGTQIDLLGVMQMIVNWWKATAAKEMQERTTTWLTDAGYNPEQFPLHQVNVEYDGIEIRNLGMARLLPVHAIFMSGGKPVHLDLNGSREEVAARFAQAIRA
jgi:hypothetical protein